MTGYVTNSGTKKVDPGGTASLSITLQIQSTSGGGTPSGGIPGYAYDAIASGLILGVAVLIWSRAIEKQ